MVPIYLLFISVHCTLWISNSAWKDCTGSGPTSNLLFTGGVTSVGYLTDHVAGPEPATFKRYCQRIYGFRSFPGQFLGLGTGLTPRVCTVSHHFEVERKCELVERLDLVHIHHGHRV